MKFILGIKPTILTGWGTTYHAKLRIRESIRGCFCYSSSFGNESNISLDNSLTLSDFHLITLSLI